LGIADFGDEFEQETEDFPFKFILLLSHAQLSYLGNVLVIVGNVERSTIPKKPTIDMKCDRQKSISFYAFRTYPKSGYKIDFSCPSGTKNQLSG
jgi:hypothetical protein